MKTIKYLIIDLSALILLCGCSMRSDEMGVSMNNRGKDLNMLKQQIIEAGDTSAYEDLAIELMDFKHGPEELLAYSFIMANKYDYKQAYFDIFHSLTELYWFDLNQMDSASAKLAIEYLLLAAEKGHEQAKRMVESYSITENRHDYVDEVCNIYK